MATLIFVLVFVLLGLGVFFVAMSGGPSGAGKRIHSQTRAGRRLALLGFVLALVVLGFVIPAAVIALDKNDNSIPQVDVNDLTAAQQRGRTLFGQRCAACHTLAASHAVAEVGPNLDQLKPPKSLVLSTIASGATGSGNMPAQIYTGQDAQDVADYVSRVAGQGGAG
ncbi:MAG TPA: cytochrome c [Solirubrobacteraceae bacterium]|jgi:mono/diheme cytochrome c family protein